MRKHALALITLKYFCINNGDQSFFSICIMINVLVGSALLFEYLCYGSVAIINILILSVRGSTSDVRI